MFFIIDVSEIVIDKLEEFRMCERLVVLIEGRRVRGLRKISKVVIVVVYLVVR